MLLDTADYTHSSPRGCKEKTHLTFKLDSVACKKLLNINQGVVIGKQV